jgi:hypothetical protein
MSDTKIVLADVLSAYVAAYPAASTGEKAKIRASLTDLLMTAVDSLNVEDMTAIRAAQAACVTAKPTAQPVDTTRLAYVRVTALRMLADRLADEHNVGDYVPDESTASDVTRFLDKITAAHGTISAEKAPASDLQADLDAGNWEAGRFYTVTEISKQVTSGTGAIAARLFPASGNCTLTGWTPVDRTATSPRGAIFNG